MEAFKPKHFAKSLSSMARQLVPKAVYEKRGVKALALIDDRLLTFIDTLRGNLGVPLTVNNWANGGNYSQSGLRDIRHYGTQAKMDRSFSQHKYGNALDFRSSKMPAQEIRQHIIENKGLYPMVSFMEVGISWVHCDCRTRLTDQQIQYWSPTEGFLSEEEVLERGL